MITNFLGNQNNAFFGGRFLLIILIFLLKKNLLVCDGHGEMGGLVSSFVKKSLPKQV
jgi:hypothetical protein